MEAMATTQFTGNTVMTSSTVERATTRSWEIAPPGIPTP